MPDRSTAPLYDLDPARSEASFSVKYIAGKVRGRFRRFHGTLRFGGRESLAEMQAEIVVDAASVDTGLARRDRDLRSPAFLAVERYPEIRFVSTHPGREFAKSIELWGNLTMHGVTRSIPVRVDYLGSEPDPIRPTAQLFEVVTAVSRKEFGMTLNQALDIGGLLVSDKIELTFRIFATPRNET